MQGDPDVGCYEEFGVREINVDNITTRLVPGKLFQSLAKTTRLEGSEGS